MRSTKPDVEEPIFIVGDGRSGTTLLRTLLSAHPRIAITPETHYMRRSAAWGGLEQSAPADFTEFWRRYTSNVRFEDLGVDAEHCLELVDAQQERTFRSAYVAVLMAYRERVGKPRVGDKTPGNIHFLPQLLAWFPRARVVIMQRDPRAVVASKLKSPWVAEHIAPPSLRHGLFTRGRLLALVRQADTWSRVLGDLAPRWAGDARVVTVSYEALVRDPEQQLRAVCQFVGEPYDARMIIGRAPDTVPLPAGQAEDAMQRWRQEHHEQTLRPISTDSIDKWRRELSPMEVAVVEGRCATTMARSGYGFTAPAGGRLAGRLLGRAVLLSAAVETQARALPRRVARLLRRVHAGG